MLRMWTGWPSPSAQQAMPPQRRSARGHRVAGVTVVALSLAVAACQHGPSQQPGGHQSPPPSRSPAPRSLARVTPCTQVISGITNRRSTPPPITDRILLPASVRLPAAAQVYAATPKGVTGKSGFLIGPRGGTCTLELGGDGSEWAHVDLPKLHADAKVELVFAGGGVGIILDSFCPFFPDVAAADHALRGDYSDCSRRVEVQVTQLRIPGFPVQIAFVRVPPGVVEPSLISTESRLATVGILTAEVSKQGGTPQLKSSQELTCTLPTGLLDVCRAALVHNLVTQAEIRGVAEDRYAPVVNQLEQLISQPPAAPQPGRSPADQQAADGTAAVNLSGEYYVYVKQVDPTKATVTFDVVQWFTGEAAQQACRDDGVAAGEGERCNDYYVRNRNELIRVLRVKPGADITVLNEYGAPAPVRPAALRQVADLIGTRSPLFQLRIEGQLITQLHQVYTP
jgi:hypothetical protein